MKKLLFVVLLLAICMWMSNCSTGSFFSSTSGIGGISGTGGPGTNPGASSTVALAYVIGNTNTVNGVRVDNAGTATITPDSPINTPSQIQDIAIRNSLLFISGFALAAAPTSITGYRADSSGALTRLSSTPINGSTFLAFDTTGGFLYASNNFVPVLGQNANTTVPGIVGYSVDQTGAVLTQVTGSPFTLAEGSSISKIAVSPSGTTVCVDVVVGVSLDNVDCYPRHPDGTIDPTVFFMALSGAVGPTDMAISGDSRWIFATGSTQNLIYYGSTFDPSVNKSAFVASVGTFPISVAADPTGKWVVVADQNSNDVVVYTISSTGAPTGGVVTALSGVPSFIRFSLTGNFLFVSTSIGTQVFHFDPVTGALKEAQGSPVPSTSPGRIAAQ